VIEEDLLLVLELELVPVPALAPELKLML